MANLNLHHLRLFRAVARDGTLTGAARGLNISQSAVSTQIKALEASLGQALFERSGRSLILTEAGRIALDHAEEIFRAADDLSATLKTAASRRTALRIGALATLSRNFQLAFLEPLIGRDDIEIVLRSGSQEDLLRGLEALSLDVVLTNLVPARDASSPYLVQRLDEQRVSLVGAQRRVPGPGANLADLLAAHPLVLPNPRYGPGSTPCWSGWGWCRRSRQRRTTWPCCGFWRARMRGLPSFRRSSCRTSWPRAGWWNSRGWTRSARSFAP